MIHLRLVPRALFCLDFFYLNKYFGYKQMAIKTDYIGLADKFAVSTSTICALHCIALPFVIGVFPAISASFLGDEAFHFWLLWAVIPLSAFGLSLGCGQHKNKTVLIAGSTGLGFLVFAALAGHVLLGEIGERAVTLLGATFIALAHVRNYRLCRSIDCTHNY